MRIREPGAAARGLVRDGADPFVRHELASLARGAMPLRLRLRDL